MKPTLELDVRHSGNLMGIERQSMTLDEKSLAHLMGVLTDLYSDNEGAVIREVSTNAADSHSAAGNPAPIQVTLPTELYPTFTVEDKGVGMDSDDILQSFSKYGWSSKRETDNEVGMLGLGCKAPLTYTSQFSLTCVKDGVEIAVLVSRGTDGVGGVEIVERRKALRCTPRPARRRGRRSRWTVKPNGVTVQVPVRDVSGFRRKAEKFFQYWEPGSVLVDGKCPESFMDGEDVLKLDPDVFVLPRANNTASVIIMGNVPYPVTYNYAPLGNTGKGAVVARVPVGSVDFTPNREALHYTPRTKETCVELRNFVSSRLSQELNARLDAAPTPAEAIKIYSAWQQYLPWPAFYRGIRIPSGIRSPARLWRYNAKTDHAKRRDGDYYSAISLADLTTNLFVVDHPTKTVTPTQRLKVQKFFEQNPQRQDSVGRRVLHLVHKDTPFNWAWPWLSRDSSNVISWDEIQGIKVDSPAARRSKPKKGIPCLGAGDKIVYESSLMQGVPVVLVSPKYHEMFHCLLTVLHDHHIVVLHPRSWERFKRDHAPDAMEMRDALSKAHEAFVKSLTPTQSAILERAVGIAALDYIAPSHKRVLDPELRSILKEMHSLQDKGIARRWSRLKTLSVSLPYRELRMELSTTKGRLIFGEIRKKYPLLIQIISGYSDDVLEYVNAVYQSRQKKGKRS